MLPFRKQLAFHQFKLTLLLIIGLSLLSIGLHIFSDWQNEKQNLDKTILQTLRLLDESATQAAYHLDESLAQRIVTGLFGDKSIYIAEIVDDQGNRLAYKERAMLQASSSLLPYSFIGRSHNLSYTLREGDYVVGKLKVAIDLAVITRDFTHRSWQIVYFQLAESVLMACLFFGIFYQLVTNPIIKISQEITGLRSPLQRDKPISIPAHHEHDELGLLVQTFNAMWLDQKQTECLPMRAIFD